MLWLQIPFTLRGHKPPSWWRRLDVETCSCMWNAGNVSRRRFIDLSLSSVTRSHNPHLLCKHICALSHCNTCTLHWCVNMTHYLFNECLVGVKFSSRLSEHHWIRARWGSRSFPLFLFCCCFLGRGGGSISWSSSYLGVTCSAAAVCVHWEYVYGVYFIIDECEGGEECRNRTEGSCDPVCVWYSTFRLRQRY